LHNETIHGLSDEHGIDVFPVAKAGGFDGKDFADRNFGQGENLRLLLFLGLRLGWERGGAEETEEPAENKKEAAVHELGAL